MQAPAPAVCRLSCWLSCTLCFFLLVLVIDAFDWLLSNCLLCMLDYAHSTVYSAGPLDLTSTHVCLPRLDSLRCTLCCVYDNKTSTCSVQNEPVATYTVQCRQVLVLEDVHKLLGNWLLCTLVPCVKQTVAMYAMRSKHLQCAKQPGGQGLHRSLTSCRCWFWVRLTGC